MFSFLLGTASACNHHSTSYTSIPRAMLQRSMAPLSICFASSGTRLRTFRSSCQEEEFLVQLTTCVENQVVAAGVLLVIKVELLSDR